MSEGRKAYERTERKLYDADGEWVGIEIVETMPRTEAKRLYPHLFILPDGEKRDDRG